MILSTDAYGLGMGAVCSQLQNGEARRSEFEYCTLNEAEREFYVGNREALTFQWAGDLASPLSMAQNSHFVELILR